MFCTEIETEANRFILVTQWRVEKPPPNRRNGRAKVGYATPRCLFRPATIDGNLVIRGKQTE